MAQFNFETIMVHAGIFHADDVFCVAMAQLLNPQIKVERVFKVPEEVDTQTTIICDIGGGLYDHHQSDAELREDGGKYAACGLFFRDFGDLLFPRNASRFAFHDRFIKPIEDADNGVSHNPLSSTISAFNGEWDTSPQEKERGFYDAVDFTRGIIKREIRNMESKIRAESLVADALEHYNEYGVITLPQYLPTDMFVGTSAKLIISPSLRGGYQLLTVKVAPGSFEDVCPLPEEWLTTKPEGCTFVHQNRFIASFETREQAQTAARPLVW